MEKINYYIRLKTETYAKNQSFTQTIYRYLIALTKGERSKRQPLNSLQWPLVVIPES